MTATCEKEPLRTTKTDPSESVKDELALGDLRREEFLLYLANRPGWLYQLDNTLKENKTQKALAVEAAEEMEWELEEFAAVLRDTLKSQVVQITKTNPNIPNSSPNGYRLNPDIEGMTTPPIYLTDKVLEALLNNPLETEGQKS